MHCEEKYATHSTQMHKYRATRIVINKTKLEKNHIEYSVAMLFLGSRGSATNASVVGQQNVNERMKNVKYKQNVA